MKGVTENLPRPIIVRNVLCAMAGLAVLWLAYGSARMAQAAQMGDMKMDGMGTMKPHMDHNAKHGGMFFMALDDMHHLEGVLEPPGIFRVYVYDEYTKPLTKNKMKEVSGTVQAGDSPDAPKIPLKLSKDGSTMEMPLAPGTKLPVTLTLLMRFPGMAANTRSELFTFPFSGFTKNVFASHPSGGKSPAGGGM